MKHINKSKNEAEEVVSIASLISFFDGYINGTKSEKSDC